MTSDPQELAPKLGLRERNKLDKLTRIRRAALELFESKGFDATTTREIAEFADVGIGTVFMYADDKRDLLFLIFNDVLDKVVDAAFDAVDTRESLSAQVTGVFHHFYRTFHERVPLARILLRELVFCSEGKQAGQSRANRQRILEGLERLTREAIERGAVRGSEDPADVAKAFFFLYSGEVRVWLTEAKPDLEAGLASLQRTFALLARGLGETAPGKAAKSKRQ